MLDPQDDEASYRHRIELKMTCVRHVQHLWDRAFPGDSRVEEMLTLAQELINQQADPKQSQIHAESFLVHVLDKTTEADFAAKTATLVAEGVLHAVISAYYRNPDYNIIGKKRKHEKGAR